MKTTVKKAKGGTRHKTVKEEKRDITRSLKSFGKSRAQAEGEIAQNLPGTEPDARGRRGTACSVIG